jgi:peptide deformylase
MNESDGILLDSKGAPVLKLVDASDPVLHRPAQLVTNIEDQVAPHIYAMKELMRAKNGCGIAAPQVGIPYRFFLMVFDGRVSLVINPTVRNGVLRETEEERCLSLPGYIGLIERYDQIKACWNDSDGKVRKMTLRGRAARIFQHDTDHCNGVCIFPNPTIKNEYQS